MIKPTWFGTKPFLIALGLVLGAVFVHSVAAFDATQRYFVNTTYYLLLAAVVCWIGTCLHGVTVSRARLTAWLKDNWPGVVTALGVTIVVGLAVSPALRILSDEANLVGTSKNLFASKTATFTVSGKSYYDSYWDVDVSIDRRPALFPFLVSLVHALVGYSYRNAFVFNLLLLPVFLLTAYRLAKALGGETFGVVAALFAIAHPSTMLAVRSGGFDFLAAFFGLLVLTSLNAFIQGQSPKQLAVLWLNLCLFAEVRYESALFILPVVVPLLLLKLIRGVTLRPYVFVYVISPAFLWPRVWQAILRGSVPEQEAGTVTFSFDNFVNNAVEYLRPVFSLSDTYQAHCALLLAVGLVGSASWLGWLVQRVRLRDWSSPRVRFAALVAVWIGTQALISFTYFWGKAQYPSAARLLIGLDTFLSFAAAWTLVSVSSRWPSFVPVLLAGSLLVTQVPVASQHRFLNRLTQTRESATTWRFFEGLGEKRILIVTDRPSHFTIMDYGAMSFEAARRDPYIFTALSRRLFYDVYVIQQIKLSTNQPLPGYELWPERQLTPVLEFQNDANVLVRVSRLARGAQNW